MKISSLGFVIGMLSAAAHAAPPENPGAPASPAKPVASSTAASGAMTPDAGGSVTATCKDGTTFSGASKKGACSGHKGVKTWTGSAAPTAGSDASADTKEAGQKASAPLATAAAGGGAGKVWVNAKSNTYHCQGDRYYGKTKEGAYMTEAEAKAKGAHADHGKACA